MNLSEKVARVALKAVAWSFVALFALSAAVVVAILRSVTKPDRGRSWYIPR